MIFHKLSCFIKRQRGFTLIEVIVALAITSLLGLGATVATGQVLTQGARNSDYTTASRHAMNAAYCVILLSLAVITIVKIRPFLIYTQKVTLP